MKTILTRLIVALLSIIALQDLVFAQDDLYITEFNDTTMFNFVGGAKLFNKRIRLTEPLNSQYGGIWLKEKRNVAKDFTIQIGFQITSVGNTGADGIAFVIQNTSPTIIGDFGGGIGYAGIPNSIAIEFDTWDNFESSDPGENHIGIQTRGKLPNSPDHSSTLGTTTRIPELEDGKVHVMRIVYEKNSMKVFLDDSINPKITAKVKLDSLLALDNGTAWLGFTSSTGGAWAAHDIVSFGHRNVSKIIANGLTPAGTICPNQVTTLSGYSSDTTTITSWKWILPNETKIGKDIQYSNSVEGEYPISLIIARGQNGPYDTITTVVKIVNPVRVIVRDTAICADQSVVLQSISNVTNAPYTFAWTSLDGGAISGPLNADSVFLPAMPPGRYHYSVEVVDAFGCDARDTVSVLISPKLTVELPSNPIVCIGGSYTSKATINGGTPPYTFLWNVNGTIDSTKDSVLSLQNIDKKITVYCTVIDSIGCKSTMEQSIVPNSPTLSFKERIGICPCVPTVIGGNAINGKPGYTYTWKAIDGIYPLELSDSTIAEPICTTSQSRKYQVEVVDMNGCSSTRDVSIEIDNAKYTVDIAIPSLKAHPLEKNAQIPIMIQNVSDSVLCYANQVTFEISYDAWVFDPNPRISKGTILSNTVSGKTRKLKISIDSLSEIHSGDTLIVISGAAIMGAPGTTDILFEKAVWKCSQLQSFNSKGNLIIDSLCKLSDASYRLFDFSGLPFLQSIKPHPAYDQFSVHAMRFHGEQVTMYMIDALGSIVDTKIWEAGISTDLHKPESYSFEYSHSWPSGIYRIIMQSAYGQDSEHCIIIH